MEIILDKTTNVEGKIKINITSEDYYDKFENEVKNLAKKAQIKGFRPGKVPLGYIKKLHGKAIISQVVTELIEKNIQSYIEEQKIAILGVPLAEPNNNKDISWDKNQSYGFTFNIGLIDKENLKVEKSINIVEYDVKADDETMKDTILRLQKSHKTLEPQEQVKENTEIKGKLSFGDKTFYTHYFSPSILKKYTSTPLVDKKKNDTVEIKFLESKKNELLHEILEEKADISTFPLEMQLIIEEIAIPQLPELDEDFFKKIYKDAELKDLPAFKEKLKGDLEVEYKRQVDRHFEKNIIEEYVKKVYVQFPEDFFRRFIQLRYENMEDEHLNDHFDNYVIYAKWDILVNEILEKNNAVVTRVDVESQAKKQMLEAYSFIPQNEEDNKMVENMLVNMLYEKNKPNKHYMDIFDSLRVTRAMDYIKSNAKLKNKSITIKKFVDLIEKENKK